MKSIAILFCLVLLTAAKRRSNRFKKIPGTFCPKQIEVICEEGMNECCADFECDEDDICCRGMCGNICRPPSKEDHGISRIDDPHCRLGPITSTEDDDENLFFTTPEEAETPISKSIDV